MRLTLILLLFSPLFLFGQQYQYSKHTNLPCVKKTFTVYIHVVNDSLGESNISEAAIYSLIENLNNAFEPICFSFAVCQINYIKEYQYDLLGSPNRMRVMTNNYNQTNHINIYMVSNVGFANSYSFRGGAFSKDRGAVVIPKSGKGLIHEFGHLFGLYHTFEDAFGKELADGSNCETAGDLICDTPADPFDGRFSPDYYLNDKCEFKHQDKDDKGNYYVTEVGNYMTHYYCAHCFFTHQQYKKMVQNFRESPYKMQ